MNFCRDTGSSPINLGSVGTTYAIVGIRKKSSSKSVVKIVGMSAYVDTNASLLVTLQKNPTLSSAPTYSDIDGSTHCEGAQGNGSITISAQGEKIYSQIITQGTSIPANVLKDILANIGMESSDEL